ncbi:MAG: hypothetical protein CMJ12_01960 [Pelagibacterales bacterium]|nr:hypothetical protein [Pelagibacterales bacterium]PPR16706.1 MAG: D-glycero-alpha-D-manno-heptose 1-phosphate guanylyltransferase [Alphaproteobacteria bacterium MarineAlpha9_Bin3]|tara:strand:+ start:505 stop:1242 length:738 start_codon:yes stop_codon:yes gene_type:complete
MKEKNTKISQAIILAAGFGKRLRPLTLKTPKPLIEINNQPIIFYILEELRKNNIKKCYINTHYLSEKIEKYINVYCKKNKAMKIIIIKESKILETGGAIKNIRKKDITQPIIVINGDSIIIPSNSKNFLTELIKNFNPNNMDFLLLLDDKKKSIGYNGKGDFALKSKKYPSLIYRKKINSLAYTGWQILNPKVIDEVNSNKFSLNICYDEAIKNNLIWGIKNSGKWMHIGTEDALNKAKEWIKNN